MLSVSIVTSVLREDEVMRKKAVLDSIESYWTLSTL